MGTEVGGAVEQGLAELQALYRLSRELASAADVDQVCEDALAGVLGTMTADRAAVLLFDDAGVMRFRAAAGLSEAYKAAVEGHSPWPADAVDPQPVSVPDVELDPTLEPLLPTIRDEGIRAVAFIPIVYAGGLLGKYMLYWNARHAVSEHELALAATLAHHIATAVARSMVEQELRESHRQLEIILQAAGNAITVMRADGRLIYANDEAAALIGFKSVEELLSAPRDEVMSAFALLDERGQAIAVHDLPTRRVLAGEDEATMNVRYRSLRTGVERWSEVRATAVKNAGGDIELIVTVFRDITERRRDEVWRDVLSQAGDVLAHTLELQPTVDHVARLAVPRLANWCGVDLLADDGSIMSAAVAHEDPERVNVARELRRRYPPDPSSEQGMVAVMRTGVPQLVPEITDEMLVAGSQDERHLEAIRELGLHSAMIVPLIARGRILGALTLVLSEPFRRYDEVDLRHAEDLGRRLGMALDNAALHQAQQAANARLVQLQRIAEIGLEARSIDELLKRLLFFVRDLLGGDRSTILLLDQDRRELRVRAAVGLDRETQTRVRVPLGHGIAGTIAATRRPLIVDDLEKANPVSQYLRDSAGSLVGVPLIVDERVLGVLHVNSDRKRAFRDVDLGFLSLVGERAALAFERTAAYEHEHRTALTLQRSVLPRDLPKIAGAMLGVRYLPGSSGLEVGGDWYDVFELDGHRVALSVGDVVGKGVEAAALMTQLRNAVRVYALEGLSPASIADRLRVMCADTFATFLYMVVDLASLRCRFINAGHNAPLLRRADGSVQYCEGGRTAALGVGHDEEVTPAELDLQPEDLLLLFTDGLVETRRRPLIAGLEELRDIVRVGPEEPEALLDHVVKELVDEDGLRDDVALLSFKLVEQRRALHLEFGTRPGELAAIRRTLDGWMASLDVEEADRDQIVLAANELCSNAIQHAEGTGLARLVAEREGDEIVLNVRDSGAWQETPSGEDRGFGLPLVSALMDQLQIEGGDDGTSVVARKRVGLRELV